MSNYLKTLVKPSKLTSWTGFIAAVLGVFLASTILVEKLHLLMDPNYVTSCSFNPIISCSTVMSSPQSAAFWGFPNPIIGLIGFTIVAIVYFISFFVKLPRFIWIANALGTILALAFCFWLASQALYVIQALCLYCCGVWIVTSVLTWFGLKAVVQDTRHADLQFYSKIGLVITLAAFAFLVFFAFQQYWMSLLT